MIILTGPSASGKTEIAKHLMERYGIAKAITHTTREPRKGEKDAVDYFFVSKEKFLALKEAGNFVETATYNGNYYGTSKSQVTIDKAVVVEVNGLKNFIALHNPEVITFYLNASEETRRKRMEMRGDKEDSIVSRLKNDRVSFAPEVIPATDFVISTESKSIEELTDMVHSLYREILKERGVDQPKRSPDVD